MIQIPINVEICNSWLAQQYLLTHTTGRQGLGFFWNSKFKGHVPNIRLLVAAAMASIQGVQISVLRNNGRLLYSLLTFNWYLRKEILTFGASFKCLGRISCPRKRQGDCDRREVSSLSHITPEGPDRPMHSEYSQVCTNQQYQTKYLAEDIICYNNKNAPKYFFFKRTFTESQCINNLITPYLCLSLICSFTYPF